MATLACTDYSPENKHNWKGHIGAEAFHKWVHGKFYEET